MKSVRMTLVQVVIAALLMCSWHCQQLLRVLMVQGYYSVVTAAYMLS